MTDSTSTPLNGRVVVVTGASRGLGRAMALMLAERGASVIVAARSTDAATEATLTIEQAVRQIEARGGTALAVPVDVRDENQVSAMARQVLDRFGRIDVLVNNAGLMLGDIAFEDIAPDAWQTVMDVNLRGAFLCCRAVLGPMLAQGAGVIVNITSGAAVRTGFLNLAYGVSKAGVDRLTLGLGAEFKDRGIACVSLSPPFSDTEGVREIYRDRNVAARAPALTAEALCRLLTDDPMQYAGKVLSVREYLALQDH
ncbi:MAG: SDR family NAD(P)-dependent oxidoreductase [Gammaproteobacteria bacterium]